MKIGMAIGTCLVCGAVLLGGPHSVHECKVGWCSQPVTEMQDLPHVERDTSKIVAPDKAVLPPPSMQWLPNNQQADLRRRGHPAWDTNSYGNAAWLEAATRQTKIAGRLE